MELSEVKAKTVQLKKTIQSLIEAYERETGVMITAISLDHYGSVGAGDHAAVKIRAELGIFL